MAKYRFNEIRTSEDILKYIGRTDVPLTAVVIRSPAVDEATGQYLADLEIDFGDYPLSQAEEDRLDSLMESKGLKLKERK